MKKPLIKLVKQAVKEEVKTPSELKSLKRKIAKEYQVSILPNASILATYKTLLKNKKIKRDEDLLRALRKRSVRTLSGVAPVAVLTKPYPCPGKCAYCPTEINVPKSYLSNEPAVMRAILCQYDPYKQVKMRIKALQQNGHPTDKIELIVIGGTWSYLPKQYQTWYLKRCFEAANNRRAKTIIKAQKVNETADNRIVGLTLETRPDYIDKEEIKRMRKLGATRVEMGVQHLDDEVLKLIKRGHLVKQTIKATKLLKEAGFKITYHMMPGLPGSSYQKDLRMFKDLFKKPDFQPDQLKIYPCVVIKGSELYGWWKKGSYKPMSDKMVPKLLRDIKKIVPPYVRIIRVIRDIPPESIEAGNKISNLRQLLRKEKIKCRCIRCREAKGKKVKPRDNKLFTKRYRASEGDEFFLSFENKKKDTLYAFLRLRIPKYPFISTLKETGLIRELHTYGELVPLNSSTKTKTVQHLGLGKRLINEAEKIVKKKGYKKIAIISGIGVREYYRKLGYQLDDTYMVKNISQNDK